MEAVCGGGVVRAELRVRGPYCFCVTLCLAAAQCTTAPHCAVVPPLVTTHITLIHGAEMLRRPTVSTPATVTYIVRIAQLLPLRMKELLNSKPPALHLERPLGPMLLCPAAWPEQWPHAALATTTHHNTPTLPQLFALNGSAFAYIWCKYQQHGYKEGKQHVE